MDRQPPMPLEQYLQEECDFSKLNPIELPYACAWEYLREVPALNTPFINSNSGSKRKWIRQKLRQYYRNEELRAYDAENKNALFQVLVHLGTSSVFDENSFPLSRWQDVSNETKEFIVDQRVWDPITVSPITRTSSSKQFIRSLARHTQVIAGMFGLIEGAEKKLPGATSKHPLPPISRDTSGGLVVASGILQPYFIAVNLTEYTREEIVHAFDQWVTTIETPLSRGKSHKTNRAYEPKTRLNWLIATRVLHRMSQKEMERSATLGKILQANQMSVSHRSYRENFLKKREEACNFFKTVIALDEYEEPLRGVSHRHVRQQCAPDSQS